MSEPTCRSCYAETLTDDELGRFNAEPVTTCVYYCPTHQAVVDQMMSKIDFSKFTVRAAGGRR